MECISAILSGWVKELRISLVILQQNYFFFLLIFLPCNLFCTYLHSNVEPVPEEADK